MGVSPTKVPSLDMIRNEVNFAIAKVSSSLDLKHKALPMQHASSDYAPLTAHNAHEEEQMAIRNLKKVSQLRRL